MSITGIETTNRAVQYEQAIQQSSGKTVSFTESMQKVKSAAVSSAGNDREIDLDRIKADLAAHADSAEDLREQLASIVEEWKAGSSVRSLMLWSDALQSAREDRQEEQESLWDILFEKRAENHEIAMDLSWQARAAARQAYADAAEQGGMVTASGGEAEAQS